MEILAALNRSKTRWLGVFIVAISFIQGSPQLKGLLSEDGYAWTMFLCGLLAVVFGFLNVNPDTTPTPPTTTPKNGGFARAWLLVTLLFGSILVTQVVGCTGTREAYKEASTGTAVEVVGDTAYVLAEHYLSVVKEAANLRESGALTGARLSQVQAVEIKSRPIFLKLKDMSETYNAVQSAKTEADLQKAVDEAVVQLAEFVRIFNKAKGAT